MGDSIVYEGTGSDLTSNVEDSAIAKKQYKEDIDRNLSIMKAIQALIPFLSCLQGFEVGFPMTVEVLKIAITLRVSP